MSCVFKSKQLQASESAATSANPTPAPARLVHNVDDLHALARFLKYVLAGLIAFPSAAADADARAERRALITSVCRVTVEEVRSSPALLAGLFELAIAELEAFLRATSAATAASETPMPIPIQGQSLTGAALQFGSATASEPQTRESEHPYADNTSRSGRVRFSGASRVRIEFDPRCSTESRHDPLTILDLNGTYDDLRRDMHMLPLCGFICSILVTAFYSHRHLSHVFTLCSH